MPKTPCRTGPVYARARAAGPPGRRPRRGRGRWHSPAIPSPVRSCAQGTSVLSSSVWAMQALSPQCSVARRTSASEAMGSLRYARPTALRTPRSPATTRGRPKVRARIHSADQTPTPRRPVRRSICLVWGAAQHRGVETPDGDGLRDVHDGARLCGRELERANRLDRRFGKPLGGEAVNDLAGDLVALPEGLGETPPRRGRPGKVHLLGADRANERREEVGLEHGPQAGKARVEAGQDGVAGEQVGPGRRCRNKRVPDRSCQ